MKTLRHLMPYSISRASHSTHHIVAQMIVKRSWLRNCSVLQQIKRHQILLTPKILQNISYL